MGTIQSLFQFLHYYQMCIYFLLLPQLVPISTLDLFKIISSNVLQADKLANKSSWTWFQALRYLKIYFLMLHEVVALQVVRFQDKQNDK